MLEAIWSALADPWGSQIMQRAVAEAVLVGVAGGALGSWVVLYGLSYGTESLSHAVFPGLVLAALTGIPLLAGGAIGLVVAAIAIALAAKAPEIGADTAISVVVTSLLGLGTLLALSPASPPGVQELLFGDVLAASAGDIALAAALAAVVVCALTALHPQFLAVGFDRSTAHALGARVLLAQLALLLLLALTVLVSVRGLGALLVVALVVGPAATARLIARRMLSMMVLAVAIAVFAAVAGLYLSYYAGTAGGASIAAAIVALYLAAFAWTALAPDRVSRSGTANA